MPLVGGRAAAAAIYPHKLCCAICRGLAAQLRADNRLIIVTPLLDRSGLMKLTHACQQASSPELNSLFFDPVESSKGPHESDTDKLIDPTLHTIFATHPSATTGVVNTAGRFPVDESVADRVMSLVERTDGEEINVLKSLRDMLKSTVDSLPAAPVRLACTHNGFDLNLIQMEVEGENGAPTGRFRWKRLNDSHKPAGKWPEHWIDPVHEADGHDIDSRVDERGGECLLHTGMSALYAQNGVEYAVDDERGFT